MRTTCCSFQTTVIFYVVLIQASHLQATTIEERLRLLPTTLVTFFGVSTTIDGNYSGVVSWGGDAEVSTFHLYDLHSGAALSSVTRPLTSNSARFSSIDISGNHLLVGSEENPISGNPVAGAAWLFDISNPNHPQELLQLTAPNVSAASNFGYPIEFRGNKALIGARGDYFPNNVPGAAYLYDLTDLNSITVTTLQPNSGNSPFDFFGITLSMNDETAIAGSFGGRAYLFDLATGMQLAELQTPSAAYSRFGESVDISDKRAIVWSQWNAGSGHTYGVAHLYDISNPTSPIYLATLTGSTPLQEIGYQGRVAIDGDWAILSARSADLDGGSSMPGAAYAFNIHDLQDVKEIRLRPTDIWAGAEFGISLDMDHTNVIVGAWGQLVNGIPSGAAYVFTVPEPAVATMFLQFVVVGLIALKRFVGLPRRRAKQRVGLKRSTYNRDQSAAAGGSVSKSIHFIGRRNGSMRSITSPF